MKSVMPKNKIKCKLSGKPDYISDFVLIDCDSVPVTTTREENLVYSIHPNKGAIGIKKPSDRIQNILNNDMDDIQSTWKSKRKFGC